ncbi:MAG: M3 family oligoendopeptidase [Anaerolineaceae bacterium]|nr:M3 family oligoendopeptidase [Anaerolineaceae bacterium]
MFNRLPSQTQEFTNWNWSQIEPYYADLLARPLNDNTIEDWLADWTRLDNLISEARTRLWIGTTTNTADKENLERFHAYLKDIMEQVEPAEQQLKEKLLASGLGVPGMEISLRDMRAEADLFRTENVPLATEELKLNTEFDQIAGTQTVQWEGEEITLLQLRTVYQRTDRTVREKAWRLEIERRTADTPAINALWQEMLAVRRQMAANAGFSDYRAYMWQARKRFDYTPEDCTTFHDSVAEVVVPAATRIYERRRQHLGLDSLRPWDLLVDPFGKPPLHPFENVDELESRMEAIFHQLDPQLGTYFTTMRQENLLDLGNRKNKSPGGYQTDLRFVKRPFIFMNAVSTHEDVQTLIHEGGHAFHCFESGVLPYSQQLEITMEVAELASMSMEMLAAPYLTHDKGGFYTPAEAARARIEHLEEIITLWPYIAQVDAFQHWIYTHIDEAADPENCDEQWMALWKRFMPGIDYSGLETGLTARWRRQSHIFQDPFYYIDYGLAQIGALQVWENALQDQAQAVKQYRSALALGSTRTLPEIFKAAGATFAFDAATFGRLVGLIERTLAELEAQIE